MLYELIIKTIDDKIELRNIEEFNAYKKKLINMSDDSITHLNSFIDS